jgi:4'-phosphopantetheinyl transferase
MNMATASTTLPEWRESSETLKLGNEDVQVWRAGLERPLGQIEYFRQMLTPDELSRADRFYFQKDRNHFIVARAVLRTILGRYLNIDPHQLRFRYSFYGKPSLAKEYDGDQLRFSVSHSHGMALFAVACCRELGVDIERIRPDVATEHIAEQFFSPREVATLRALPADRQIEAFFNCWTRKEAYIKARGEGLSLPLNQFDVSLTPGEPATLLNVQGDMSEVSRWSLQELNPYLGYVAALVVEGQEWRLGCWQQPEW